MIVAEIRKQAADGRRPAAVVIGDAAWPFAWYLRREPVDWAFTNDAALPPIVALNPEQEQLFYEQSSLVQHYSREIVPLRAWWLPQQQTPGIGEVLQYLLTRKPWGNIGAREILVLRAKTP